MATVLRRSLTALLIASVAAILFLLFLHRAATPPLDPTLSGEITCEPVVDTGQPSDEGNVVSEVAPCNRARETTLAWALLIGMTTPFQIWARSRYAAEGVEPFIGSAEER